MSYLNHLAYALTDAFRSSGDKFQSSELQKLGAQVIGHSPVWLDMLCKSLASQTSLLKHPAQLKRYIQSFPALIEANQQGKIKPPLRHYFLPPEQMLATPDFVIKSIPQLHNEAQLLAFLNLSSKQLHWLSKPWLNSFQPESFALHNYLYRWQKKARCGQYRLIEIPKKRLKSIQKTISTEILDKIPLHACAHGFRKGYSIKTCAVMHQNKRWVLKMDLKNFFLSIPYSRIYGIFTHLGYPKSVARKLSLLCTNSPPESLLKSKIADWQQRKIYHIPHLPQGAPSSPVLSNLSAFKLDCRLSALAKSIQTDYSRYADDLFFSGNNYQDFSRLIPLIGSIAADEKFLINFKKTRVMGSGQQQKVTGIVVNKTCNLDRKDYERLKAIMHNCVRHGVLSQQGEHANLYSHLKGQIAFVNMLNPNKAKKLEQLFSRIQWPINKSHL